MIKFTTPRFRAEQYHKRLPEEIRRYLKGLGIADSVIDRQLIGWSGKRVTIPVFTRHQDVAFFRFAKAPGDKSAGPEILSEVGSSVDLYGWDTLVREPHTVIICESEFDRLALESHAYAAVSSTGGASVFLPQWTPAFEKIPRIFICFDSNPASQAAAKHVKTLIPKASIVTLPDDVGEKAGVTRFFGELGRTRVDFELLLAAAATRAERNDAPADSPFAREEELRRTSVRRRAERTRNAVPLQKIVEWYTDLAPDGGALVGLCPFHEETSPSFTVYPDRGTYFCFGCEESGDVIAFLMRRESMTYGQALEALEEYRYADDE
jgi:DNA primase